MKKTWTKPTIDATNMNLAANTAKTGHSDAITGHHYDSHAS